MSGQAVPGGSTPVPNWLLDEVMPELTDTEWRVLCVVVRQTLGWQASLSEPRTRKRSDWITHSQLKRRTGRASAAVSGAIAGLVCRGLIEVEDRAGNVLRSAMERRRAYTRLHFRLAVPPTKREGLNGAENADSFSESGIQKAKTTKETETKSEIAQESTETENERISAVIDDGQPTGAVSDATLSFANEYRAKFKFHMAEDETPPVCDEDLKRLQTHLERFGERELARRLDTFFACKFGYVRRRGYSLRSFLDTVSLLPLRNQLS